MQQRELVSGFSELKELLIRTYQIDKERAQIKLYFVSKDNELLMHDYDDHKKRVLLVKNMKSKDLNQILNGHSRQIVLMALNAANPSEYLNNGFKLNGFFRS